MRICYVASGLHYTPSAGPSSHVISLVEALARKAAVEVTLAFNGYREIPPLPVEKRDLDNVEHGSLAARPSARLDDLAVSGIDPRPYISYMRRCGAFVRRSAGLFDAVIERMWRAGGLVGAGFRTQGLVYILEENGPPGWSWRKKSVADLPRWMLHYLSRMYARWAYSRPHGIVVQSEELRQLLHRRFFVNMHRVHVVPNGVDLRRFRPMDQSRCRRDLGLDPEAFILLFVGSLDVYHDLIPCMEAMARMPVQRMQLHIVGDGVSRGALEDAAARLLPGRCILHGSIPHNQIPLWINAADVCIAPYLDQAFEEGRFYFSPLKILEYMACGKPVISQPHTGIAQLVRHGAAGYLILNTPEAWRSCLASLPGKEAMAAMGQRNLQRAALHSWDAVADRYLEIIQEARQ